MKESETPVLIIGGGPTGLALALELSLQNISFTIIDAAPARDPHSRAIIVQSRTLELLARHRDVSDKLIPYGTVGLGLHVFVNRRSVAELNIEDDILPKDTPFPLPVWISQANTERFLDEALAEYDGCAVRRPWIADTVTQDGSGVVVKVRNTQTGEEELIRAQYVVGCDGAHSTVRRAAGLKFIGAAYGQEFLLADLHVKWENKEEEDKRLCLFFGYGSMVGFPMDKGIWRIVAVRMPWLGSEGLAKNDDPTLEDVQRIWGAMAPGKAVLADPIWMSKFKLHHRGVECYRRGRLFVAGDAAHIHSPAGGQGMNTGIQDSINLGWKLAAVLRGESDEKLLDSYDVERRPVGETLSKGTDRIFQFASTGNPVVVFLRNLLLPWIVPWVLGNPIRKAKIYRFVSQLGIRYRRSPVVGRGSTYKGPLYGGDRAPNALLQGPDGPSSIFELCNGSTHHFFLYSGTGSTNKSEEELQQIADFLFKINVDFAKTHKILSEKSQETYSYFDEEGQLSACYGFTEPGYIFVRPDGYIAHIGYLEAIGEFQEWLEVYMKPSL